MKSRFGIFVIFAIVTGALLSYGLYQALVLAPAERTMGQVSRILYIHVSNAWAAGFCFSVNFIAAVIYLARRSRQADAIAVSSAEVGVVFCTVVLVTGPIWGKYAWGIWWAWDARLTSTLVLWLIYISYLMLRRFAQGGQAATISAVLAIFGFVDAAFVYFSIRFFRTQHPQPVFAGGPGAGLKSPGMVHAFLWNLLSFTCYAVLLMLVRYRLERLRQMREDRMLLRAGALEAAR